jgi:hypothetical protein
VKLQAIDEKEPTKKFMGRQRNTAEEESKKHNPIAARGLGDVLGAGEDDRIPQTLREPTGWPCCRSFCSSSSPYAQPSW